MSVLTKDNRDMLEIESELRARIEAQRHALETLRAENDRLREENALLRGLLDTEPQGYVCEPDLISVSARA